MAKIVHHETVKNPSTLTTERLIADVRKMAKQANQRLVRLERAGQTMSYAYQQAEKYLYDQEGRERFKEHTKPLTRQQLVKEYKALDKFLGYKTSTVQENRRLERQRVQSFGDKYGVKIKPEQRDKYYALWQRIGGKQREDRFTSEVLAKTIKRSFSENIPIQKVEEALQEVERQLAADKSGRIFETREISGFVDKALDRRK